jgi:hypothetical protein
MMLEAPDRAAVAPVTARAGDVVGLFETLAGLPVGRRQRIVHTRRRYGSQARPSSI